MRATYRLIRACGMDLLSGGVRPVCFVRVSRAAMSLGVRVACVALAGTVGAMGMLVYRRGGITEMFAAGGHLLAPGASRSLALLGGLGIHVVWMAVWSVVFAALVQRDRRLRASIAAVVIAALAFGASIVAPAGIGGPLATLPPIERAVVHVVLAISFVIGMRLASTGDGPGVRRVSNGEGSAIAN